MTYSQVMAYLQESLVLGSIPGLETMTRLLEEMGNPQEGLSFVHVAGTNGKGSTCAFIAECLKQAGYKTGLYTSPYISHFTERIEINGVPIPEADVAACGEKVITAAEAIVSRGFQKPTVFELTTAIGFEYFKRSGCDIVVLEVGLGGRLDATNVIQAPVVSVIARIGLDHMEILGDTIEKIAWEKAGIVKPGVPTVILSQEPSVVDVVAEVCREKSSPLHIADASAVKNPRPTPEGLVFDYGRYGQLCSGLTALYQTANAALAIETVEILRQNGYSISDEALRAGITKAYIPGRFERLWDKPAIVLDGAHNPQGAHALAESLKTAFPGKKIRFIMGALSDKDYRSSIQAIKDLAERFYTVTPNIYRALGAPALAQTLREETGLPAESYESISEAVQAALSNAGPDDVICAFGSLYLIGDIKESFKSALGKIDQPAAETSKKTEPPVTSQPPQKAKKKIPVKILCQVAVLIAIEIVLNRFLSFKTMGLKIGFSFVPIALCGMVLGPWYAAITYAIADFLGALLFPMGPIHPGFTVCAALMGLSYGYFLNTRYWKKIRFFPNVVVPSVLCCLVFGLLINTLWVSQLYGSRTYWGWFMYRLSEYAILLPLNLVLLPLIGKLANTLKKTNLV